MWYYLFMIGLLTTNKHYITCCPNVDNPYLAKCIYKLYDKILIQSAEKEGRYQGKENINGH